MARNATYSNAEMKAGIFIVVCALLFVAMMFVYGKASRLWVNKDTLSVVFTSVTSLRPDAPVRFNGVEVGRVKHIRILNLDEQNLERLPLLTAGMLDNLPLTDAERAELKAIPLPPNADEAAQQEYNQLIRQKIKDRTMIELNLEVLSPLDEAGATKRYRVDDQVRISTTLLGDTSVEIASGRGELIVANENRLVLGNSGDFFTDLGKSIEQVKEILANVSDVVGSQERDSVRQALRRFDSITEKIERVVELASTRLPVTWNKVDLLADSAKKDLDIIGETVANVQPQLIKTLNNADEAVRDLQQRVGNLTDEARQAVVDLKTQIKPILTDVKFITENSKEDFPLLVKNTKDLADRLKSSADKLDGVLLTSDRLLNESYPDLRRLILGFRRGAENFEEATNLLKRKPWLIMNKPKDESEFAGAQRNAQQLELMTRGFRELNTELQAVLRGMPKNATPDDMKRLQQIIQELNILSDTLKDAGNVMRKQILPEYARKKGSFVEVSEPIELGK